MRFVSELVVHAAWALIQLATEGKWAWTMGNDKIYGGITEALMGNAITKQAIESADVTTIMTR